jgi:hypothetical protein
MIEDAERKLIAKFSSSTDTYNVVKAEYVAMRLAAMLGLDAAPVQFGLVAYLCRSDYSFRLPGVRRPGGFCPPKLNAFGAGYRSR